MSFWKNIFSSQNSDKSNVRELTHPKDLQTGDIIKFKYLAQAMLSNQQFQISGIGTYDFKDRHLTEFKLTGNTDETLFMMVDDSDDETILTISVKLTRHMTEQMFDLDQFALVFDGDGHIALARQQEPQDYQHWSAPLYRQEICAEPGYYYKKDYRNIPLPEYQGNGDALEYYRLISDDRQFAIEAEVYEGGETDVLMTLRRPLSDIDEMWPSATP